jgi:hypothetical protein
MSGTSPKKLDRVDAVALVRTEGFPLALSTFEKESAAGNGPPAERWGRKDLFRADDVRRWIRQRAARLAPHTQ